VLLPEQAAPDEALEALRAQVASTVAGKSLCITVLPRADWDARYERDRQPEWGERVAYISRQRRREEIVRKLLHLVPVQPETD
jgi:hypothetical protein